MIHGIIFTISLAFIFIPTMLYPQSHKMLRSQKVYKLLLGFSILLPILSSFVFEENMSDIEKQNSFISLCPLIFLTLYKCYDNIILRKYNRHFHFFVRFNYAWKDKESDESTSFELWLTVSLLIIPLILSYSISWLILNFI